MGHLKLVLKQRQELRPGLRDIWEQFSSGGQDAF